MSLLQKGSEDKKPSYQKTSLNGSPPLARLQQKVARLEISLRDKDSELLKLNESTKSTVVNELRIQTEMYYQEVIRLRNQLNLLQETQTLPKAASIQESSGCINELSKQAREKKNLINQNDLKLKESIEKLKNENNKLSQKLSSIQAEKEKLSKEFQEVLKKSDSKLRKKTLIVMEESTQTSPKHNNFLEVTLPPSQATKPTEESISLLKSQIEELLGKEKAWDQERASFKELVINLQEDRSFYKDASQQKHEELGSLQNEMLQLHKDVLLLQKDIGVINDTGRPLCSQCSQNSSVKNCRSVKSKSKTLMRSSKSLPKSQNVKNSNTSLSPTETSAQSSQRTKTLKTLEKCSKSRKDTLSSSASSSCSNSAQSSPAHLDSPKMRSSSPNALKSSGSITAEERTLTSPMKSDSSISDVHTKHKLLSKISRRSSSAQSSHVATQIPFSLPNSPSSLKSTLSLTKSARSSISGKSQPLSVIANSIKPPTVPSQSPKMKSNHSALNKSSSISSKSSSKSVLLPKSYPVVAKSKVTNASKLHRSLSLSPRKLPITFQTSSAKPSISQKHQNSSINSILSTSSTLEKVTSLDKDNEEFLLTCDLHSKISNKVDIEVANEILKDLNESGLGDSVIKRCSATQASDIDGEASSLNDSPKQMHSSTSNSISKVPKSASIKSDSNKKLSSSDESKEKHHMEENLIAIFESHLVRSSKLKVINPKWKSTVSPQRKKLFKKKEREKGELSSFTDQSQETEDEIEEMVSLLEAHVARKAFLAFVNENKEASTT